MRDETADYTARQSEDVTTTTGADQSTFQGEESLLDDGELTGSTPRPPASKMMKTHFASLESPYEALKREMKGEEQEDTTQMDDDEDENSTVLFAQRTAQLPDMSMTGRPSLEKQLEDQQSNQRHKDPLLHRILDKNYRLQVSPHKSAPRISPSKGPASGKKAATAAWQDSPMSSPVMAVPTLRSEAFMSPYKSNAKQRLAAATAAPRTPGVSVQTPGTARKTRDVFAAEDGERSGGKLQKYEIDWDDDGDDDIDLYAGMSPPKTIQFAPPPSKLLQTPGKC